MRDLNLLRSLGYDVQNDPRQLKSFIYGGTAALLALALYTGHMGYMLYQRGQLAQRIEHLEDEIGSRRTKVTEIDDAVAALEAESAGEREHIAALQTIEKNLALFTSERRARVEHAVRAAVVATPGEIALTSVSRDSEAMRLIGNAKSGLEVAQYVRTLGRLTSIAAANLERLEEKKDKDSTRYDFEIVCSTR